MASATTPPRVLVTVGEDLMNRLRRCFEHGEREKALLRVIMDIVEMIEEDPINKVRLQRYKLVISKEERKNEA